MTVANRLANYLSISQTHYRVIPHTLTQSAADSAHASHLPASRVVKSVLLRDRKDGRYMVALTPACNRLKLPWVVREMTADPVLAREAEMSEVFPDCTLGAVPGFGQAYQLNVVWDDALSGQPSLYFEAGNHKELIEIDQDDFQQLFHNPPHAAISLPHEGYALYHADEVRSSPH